MTFYCNVSVTNIKNRDSASLLFGVTDMATVHAMGHILLVRDAMIVLLTAEELLLIPKLSL